MENIIMKPGQNYVNGQSILDRSSMMTYSKIVCCLCSAVIDANPTGICDACAKKNIDITTGFPKEFVLIFCKQCKRYNRPPWIHIERESQEMMSFCLSKLKSFSHKFKIIDSSFIFTEPHSRIIKIKITIQKELDKNLVTQDVIINYKEENILCRDCQKLQTPHIWVSCVQIRQRVPHKRTLMYLEQIILKNKMQEKALSIKEVNEGVDFYFTSKRDGELFTEFIASVVPTKITHSKKYVSMSTTTFTFLLDIANVAKYDLFIMDDETMKHFGGIGPLLLCTRLSSRTSFIDLISYKTIDIDANIFFKYKFNNFVNTNFLTEFNILDVQEDIDYQKKYKKNNLEDNNNNNDDSSIAGSSIKSISTNYQKNGEKEQIEEKNNIERIKNINIKVMRDDGEIFDITSHLALKIKPGDTYYGYDLERINFHGFNEEFMDAYKNLIPNIILIRKKNENLIGKKLKLNQINMERKEDLKKGKKNEMDNEKEYNEFIEEIYEEKDLKENIEFE